MADNNTPDIVTEARRRITDLFDSQDDEVQALRRATADLVIEVERLRAALDQRTVPELAARLRRTIRSMEDNDSAGWVEEIRACGEAARLLGGDR